MGAFERTTERRAVARGVRVVTTVPRLRVAEQNDLDAISEHADTDATTMVRRR
jgi:hypothetical protein